MSAQELFKNSKRKFFQEFSRKRKKKFHAGLKNTILSKKRAQILKKLKKTRTRARLLLVGFFHYVACLSCCLLSFFKKSWNLERKKSRYVKIFFKKFMIDSSWLIFEQVMIGIIISARTIIRSKGENSRFLISFLKYRKVCDVRLWDSDEQPI